MGPPVTAADRHAVYLELAADLRATGERGSGERGSDLAALLVEQLADELVEAPTRAPRAAAAGG